FQGPKGRGWLMRWLPSRAHDNGMFLIFSNGVGVDDDEVRTGNAMILDPYGEILVESRKAGDDMVVADLNASELPMSSGRRWLQARRPELYAMLTEPQGIEEQRAAVRFGQAGSARERSQAGGAAWGAFCATLVAASSAEGFARDFGALRRHRVGR